MSTEPVTPDYNMLFKKMAEERGVSPKDLKDAISDGRVARFLDGLRFAPPEGGQIHIIYPLFDALLLGWTAKSLLEGMECLGFNTDIERFSGRFETPAVGAELYVLLNCESITFRDACTWAKVKGLERTTPKELFLVIRRYPKMHTDLRLGSMCMFATETYRSKTCFAWQNQSMRGIGIAAASRCLGNKDCWLLFRKPFAEKK